MSYVKQHRKIKALQLTLCQLQQHKNLAKALQQEALQWMSDIGFQGLGIGLRVKDNQPVDQLCLKVYVEQKKPLEILSYAFSPKLSFGQEQIPVDVEAVGQIQLHQAQYQGYQRPLSPGLGIGNIDRGRGTIGLIVRDKKAPSSLYILSCHHVLAPKGASDNRAVLQPALENDGRFPLHHIADHVRSIPPEFSAEGFPNIADAAIAQIKPEIAVSGTLPLIRQIKGIAGNIFKGKTVRFVGSSSGFGAGVILDTDYMMNLRYYDSDGQIKRIGFRDQIMCTPYAKPGDSGAVIVNQSGKAIGLHVAGSESHSVFCRIKPVLDYFGVIPVY